MLRERLCHDLFVPPLGCCLNSVHGASVMVNGVLFQRKDSSEVGSSAQLATLWTGRSEPSETPTKNSTHELQGRCGRYRVGCYRTSCIGVLLCERRLKRRQAETKAVFQPLCSQPRPLAKLVEEAPQFHGAILVHLCQTWCAGVQRPWGWGMLGYRYSDPDCLVGFVCTTVSHCSDE